MKETKLKRGMHTHLKALKRGKTLTQALTRGLRRKSAKCEALAPKSQTLASKTQFVPLRELQWCQKPLEGSWNDTRLEESEEKGEKLRRRRLFKFPAPTNRLTDSSTGRPPGQRSTRSTLRFLCISLSRDPPPALFS